MFTADVAVVVLVITALCGVQDGAGRFWVRVQVIEQTFGAQTPFV